MTIMTGEDSATKESRGPRRRGVPSSRRRVFLSHSRADRDIVLQVAAALITHRLPVWLDRWELKPGDSIIERIESGIAASGYMVVFLSPASARSRWVRREMSSALMAELTDRSITVVVALLPGSSETDVPGLLRDKLWVDFRVDLTEGVAALFELFGRKRRSSDLLTARAASQINTGRPFDAIPLLERALALYPSNYEAMYFLAIASDLTQSSVDRVALLRTASAGRRNSALFKVALGVELVKHGDTSTGVPTLKEACVLDPESTAVHFAAAMALRFAGEHRAAQEAFERYLAGDHDALDAEQVLQARFNLALSRASTGDHRGAVAEYEAIDDWERRSDVLTARATSIAHLGDPQATLLAWEAARDASPGEIEPHTALAEVYFKQGRFSEAVREGRQIVSIAPGNATAHHNLARLLWATRRHADAIVLYYQTLELDPTISGVREELRRLLAEASGGDDERESADESNRRIEVRLRHDAIDRLPTRELEILDTLTDEAATAMAADDQSAMILVSNRLETLPPGSDIGEQRRLSLLGALYLRIGAPDEAVRCCRAAVSVMPGAHWLHRNLAVAYEASGRPDRALEEWDLAVVLGPKDCGLEFELIMKLGLADLLDAARARLERFVLECAESEHVGKARELLAAYEQDDETSS